MLGFTSATVCHATETMAQDCARSVLQLIPCFILIPHQILSSPKMWCCQVSYGSLLAPGEDMAEVEAAGAGGRRGMSHLSQPAYPVSQVRPSLPLHDTSKDNHACLLTICQLATHANQEASASQAASASQRLQQISEHQQSASNHVASSSVKYSNSMIVASLGLYVASWQLPPSQRQGCLTFPSPFFLLNFLLPQMCSLLCKASSTVMLPHIYACQKCS